MIAGCLVWGPCNYPSPLPNFPLWRNYKQENQEKKSSGSMVDIDSKRFGNHYTMVTPTS